MPRPARGNPQGGLEGEDLLGTCYRAWAAARQGAGLSGLPWDGLPEHCQQGFAHAVAWAKQTAESLEEGGAATFSGTAKDAYFQYQVGQGSTPAPLESVDPREFVCMEAVVRHMMNALEWDRDEDGDIAGHEDGWKDWAYERARALQLTDAQRESLRQRKEDTSDG